MNYEMEISQHLPATFLSLNGGVPPLVSGSGSATRLTSSVDTTTLVFNAGAETIPFTFEVWFYPLTNTGEQVVVGHGSEGVLWDGSKFILRIKQGDGAEITQSTWTPTEVKAFHVVMTYTPGAALLYVDGEMVTSVELSQSLFNATNHPVRINGGTGSGIYDSFAVYYRALTSREIAQHYNWGNDVPDSTTIAMSKGATTWDLTYANVDLAKSFVYDEANFAESSYMDNVNIEDGKIIANVGGGEWRQSMVVSALIGTTSAGVHVTHESAGASFSYSLDGETWIPVTNKTTILEDVTIEVDAILYFRLQLTDENSWVNSLILDVLASRIMRPIAGKRNLTFKSVAFDQTPGNQLDYHRDAGAVINAGGHLTIGLDESEEPKNVKVVQFWAKFDGAALLFNSDNRTAVVKADGLVGYNTGALEIYANGTYVSSDQTSIRFNEWNFFSVRLTSADNKTAIVGAPGVTIYGLATYPTIPVETYGFNVGAPALRVNDAGGLTWTESSPGAQIHAYNWSYFASETP